ncbi:MAG: hypothetical protein H6626_11090 [Pseudobdellovibrionaceae bacterium]|nr:MAG: hypothetical protein H6626_11090 [Pseudobdellovibrionaceae bacterium]
MHRDFLWRNNQGRVRPFTASFLLVVFSVLVLVFQNCDPQLVQDGNSFGKNIKFAFNSTVDHLAYMSCDGLSQNKLDKYYTFRVKAVGNNSGVQLKPQFFEDAKFYSEDEIPDLLAASPANDGAELQLAVRSVYDMQELKATSLTDGEDIDNLIAPLTKSPVIETLLDGAFHREFTGFNDAGGARSVDGRLSFIKSHADVTDLRAALDDSTSNAQYLLALTYKDATLGKAAAKQPESEEGESNAGLAYGTGYKVRFSSSYGSNRRMHYVREINLENGQSASTSWQCKQYLMVRSNDTGNFSEGEDDGDVAARNMLPSGFQIGEYEVNSSMVEAVKAPQDGNSCYGGLLDTIAVNYTNSCNEQSNCPHYFSVCWRQ